MIGQDLGAGISGSQMSAKRQKRTFVFSALRAGEPAIDGLITRLVACRLHPPNSDLGPCRHPRNVGVNLFRPSRDQWIFGRDERSLQPKVVQPPFTYSKPIGRVRCGRN